MDNIYLDTLEIVCLVKTRVDNTLHYYLTQAYRVLLVYDGVSC